MLFVIMIFSVNTSRMDFHQLYKRSLEATNMPFNNSELMYIKDNFDQNYMTTPFNATYNSESVNYFKSFYNNDFEREIRNCPEHFEFKPKKILYNEINWKKITKASDLVFDALMSHEDVINIISIIEDTNELINDLRYYFKVFTTKFLLKQPTKRRLRQIGHLFEILAYHSYDLIFDLSFFTSFTNPKEIEKLKNLVYGYIDIRINSSCDWYITQLYSEQMYSNDKKNKTTEYQNEDEQYLYKV
ncbi:uncharacterized protein VNE69_06010 [Vairimorpha necatrix]|uniref:Uncharacterized protein n=1 Tax=Vairimorpha necatrix TaxID=6039 RepID=A0AAX4JCK2_9MICR